MTSLFADLAVRGTIGAALLLLIELCLPGTGVRRVRRLSWILSGVLWLVPFHLPRVTALPTLPNLNIISVLTLASSSAPNDQAISQFHQSPIRAILVGLWWAGLIGTLVAVCVSTLRAAARWNGERLCTDSRWLRILEDCKSVAGVTVPIGLVVTADLRMPALFGWLRPRILLPTALAESVTEDELRSIFLHELAHFRWADIPLQWLFTAVLAVHWFNPVAHWAVRRWYRAREIGADAQVLEWLPREKAGVYGRALVHALRSSAGSDAPRGALALGESMQEIKARLTLIAAGDRARGGAAAPVLVALALAGLVVLPSRIPGGPLIVEQAKASAQLMATEWIKMVDGSDYTNSWKMASSLAQKTFTFDSWKQVCEAERQRTGPIKHRQLVSLDYLSRIPQSSGAFIEGNFVILHYKSTFAQLANGQETVWMMYDVDGKWRPCGYLISGGAPPH